VIWSLQVAIRGTVSLTAYKTQLKNARHRLNEAPRQRRILQMVQPLS
ncbi:IS4 family transposase, partial [Escherichia coli]|nr:IS4 family transposase [Escherichia coli]